MTKATPSFSAVSLLPRASIWPSRTDWWVIVIYWVIALSLVAPDYFADYPWPRALGASLFNVISDTAAVIVIVYWLIPRFLASARYVLFFVVAFAFTLLDGAIYNLGYEVFFEPNSIEITFNQALNGIVQHLASYGLLGMILLGKKMFEVQRRFLLLAKERRENELRMLKAQIDPHFLFNNLNILDVLIARDAELAQEFLRNLSGLYRYLLRHKDEDVVTLQEELTFSEGYIFLLQQRFGDTFRFSTTIQTPATDKVYLPPGALQTLIENVVKHNQGRADIPLLTSITADAEQLVIQNDLRPKTTLPDHSGVGLANLQARYALLTDRLVEVNQTATHFTVVLPLLPLTTA